MFYVHPYLGKISIWLIYHDVITWLSLGFDPTFAWQRPPTHRFMNTAGNSTVASWKVGVMWRDPCSPVEVFIAKLCSKVFLKTCYHGFKAMRNFFGSTILWVNNSSVRLHRTWRGSGPWHGPKNWTGGWRSVQVVLLWVQLWLPLMKRALWKFAAIYLCFGTMYTHTYMYT